MKREDLLKLASEIFDYEFRENTPQFARIEQFAKRIAEHEREECAKIMYDAANACAEEDSDPQPFVWACAAIRARSE